MSDVSFALEAKSNQLNAVDIIGAEPVLHIRDVHVSQGQDQPVSVFFDGDHGRPWKPSKGMLRLLAGAWGRDSAAWIGKHVQVYCDPTVKWAGQEVGGIRIRAMSDIKAEGLSFVIALNRKQREPYHVPLLVVETKPYPAEKFSKALPVMTEKMKTGEMTLQQVIAQCQKTGQLTPEQLSALEEAAPVEIGTNDDNEEM